MRTRRPRHVRLTEPLVRENGELRPATLGRGAGARRRRPARRARRRLRDVQLLQGHERDELRRAEVLAGGDGQQQRRQLQPHLTRSQRRRSDDGVRCRRRHLRLRGGGTRRPDRAVGLQRAGDAPDLLPPRAAGPPPRHPHVLGGPAPHLHRAVGRRLARARRRHRHRAGQRDRPRDHPRRAGERAFVDRATTGFEEYRATVEPYTLERGEEITGVPAATIRELAHAYARADRAQICWTLGITEHHNAADYVFALINLALLTGHVGRYGSGLVPLRGQNNVQGGGDMGAIPAKLPGGYDLDDEEARARFATVWGSDDYPREPGHAPVADVRGDGARRAQGALLHRGEPGGVRGQRDARPAHARGPGHPDRAGHLPHGHRGARRRRVPRDGGLVRVRGHGHQLRAPGAARPQGDRPAGAGAPGHPHHLRAGHRARARLGRADRRAGVGRAALGVAELARRDELRAPRRARRHPVAVPVARTTPARR